MGDVSTTPAVPSKPLWQSKTLWMNAIMGVLAFFPACQSALTAHPEMVMIGWSVINLVLRYVTKSSIQIGD